MDWIKKNPAQLFLALVAAGVLAAAFLLYTKVGEFKTAFNGSKGPVIKDNKIPALDSENITAAQKAIGTPSSWEAPKDKDAGRLFVSKKYVLKSGALVKPGIGMFNPPVPNEWLDKYNLDSLNPAVLDEDGDKDGFNTLLESKGLDALSHLDMAGQPVMGKDGKALPDDSTDPTDPKSHPAYHTRLFLRQVVSIPFRLRCMSYDKNKAGKVDTVQINTIDRGNKTMFVTIGDDIPGTHFKTLSFEEKEVPDKDGTKKDVSELTIINNETQEKLTLVLGVVRDSPESYIILQYLWVAFGGQKTPDMNLKKGATFTLPPESDKTYKVIDIKAPEPQKGLVGEVKIQLPSGEIITLHPVR